MHKKADSIYEPRGTTEKASNIVRRVQSTSCEGQCLHRALMSSRFSKQTGERRAFWEKGRTRAWCVGSIKKGLRGLKHRHEREKWSREGPG